MITLVSQVTDATPADLAQTFGAFGAVLAIAYWFLGRTDRQVDKERADAALEIARVAKLLEVEQAAHEETRRLLYDELRKKRQPKEDQ